MKGIGPIITSGIGLLAAIHVTKVATDLTKEMGKKAMVSTKRKRTGDEKIDQMLGLR